jgi:hypothetical protein
MKYFQILSAALLCLAIAGTTSCKKDPAPIPTGTFLMHIHTNIDSTEVEEGNIAVDANGRHIQLDVAKLLISNIQLKKSDGTYYTVGNAYLLKTIDEEVYTVGSVPAGNYLSVKFNVGLNAILNARTPTSFASTSPLADINNWFGTTSEGYIFADLEGKADVSANQSGPVNQAFSYQLGGSSMLQSVSLPDKTFTVIANSDNLVHLTADYGILLQGIDFKTQSTATPSQNATPGVQIANNIPNMFRYEE